MEFCKCGSLMINGGCTNKNCANKPAGETDAGVRRKSRSTKAKPAKSANPRRTSKMVTYNLYETEEDEKHEENAL